MGKPWTEKLLPSEITFMNEIIAQVPEEHGARAAFIDIIQKLADAPAEPKFRYLIALSDAGYVRGTNDQDLALRYAVDDVNYILDTVESKWLPEADLSAAFDITEADYFDDSEAFGGGE